MNDKKIENQEYNKIKYYNPKARIDTKPSDFHGAEYAKYPQGSEEKKKRSLH